MSTSTAELMSKGMNCLMEHLGIVEAEKFERDEPYSGDAVRL